VITKKKMGKRRAPEGRASKEKRRKRSRRSPSPRPAGRELHAAAALGDRRRCRELLRRGADPHWTDAELATPLHAACRQGHADVVALLLRRGAAAGAQDLRGDTPAHLAARHGHIPALTALLRAAHPPSLDAPNDRGETARQITAAAIAARTAQDALARERRGGGAGGGSEDDAGGAWGGGGRASSWEERLQEELSEGEEAAWGAFGGGGAWHADAHETADEFARRIWQEMRAKQAAAAAAELSAAAAARREGEARRERARREAAGASARVLDRERAADAAWRAAMAAGAAGAKRASYEARWELFCAARARDRPVGFADVPWILPPPDPAGGTGLESLSAEGEEELRRVVLFGAASPEERRRRLRAELIRWHPDKWQARWGRELAPAERERVLEGVTALSQALTAMHAAAQAEVAAAGEPMVGPPPAP
jgi:NF-kappa-B inhibitor-like protein 1